MSATAVRPAPHSPSTDASAPTPTSRPSRGATPTKRSRWTRSLRLLVVDSAFLAAFIAVIDVPLTGLAIHEWLGLSIGVLIVAHTVQHMDWILATSRRFFARMPFVNRLNWIMMVVLWTAFVSALVSGLVISNVVVPALGIPTSTSPWWLWLHATSASVTVIATAWHLALNWRWIVNTVTRRRPRREAA